MTSENNETDLLMKLSKERQSRVRAEQALMALMFEAGHLYSEARKLIDVMFSPEETPGSNSLPIATTVVKTLLCIADTSSLCALNISDPPWDIPDELRAKLRDPSVRDMPQEFHDKVMKTLKKAAIKEAERWNQFTEDKNIESPAQEKQRLMTEFEAKARAKSEESEKVLRKISSCP